MKNLDVNVTDMIIASEKEFSNQYKINRFIWVIKEMKDESNKLSKVLQNLNRELIDIKEEWEHI